MIHPIPSRSNPAARTGRERNWMPKRMKAPAVVSAMPGEVFMALFYSCRPPKQRM
jgi:hypothetical protein